MRAEIGAMRVDFMNLAEASRINGRLDVQALEGAYRHVLSQNAGLSSRFVLRGSRPVQLVNGAGALDFSCADLRHLPRASKESQARQLVTREAWRPFDLSSGPLLRAGVVRTGDEEWIDYWVVCHLVADAWSKGIIRRERDEAYAALAGGIAPPPKTALDYVQFVRDYFAGLSDPAVQRDLGYWVGQLSSAPPVKPPVREPGKPRKEAKASTRLFSIGAQLTSDLRRTSRENGVSLFITLLTAFKLLVARWSGHSDVVVPTVTTNRTRRTDQVIAPMVHVMALRTNFTGYENADAATLLSLVRGTFSEGLRHGHAPFRMIADEVGKRRNLDELFWATFQFQNLAKDPQAYTISAEEWQGHAPLALDPLPGGAQREIFPIDPPPETSYYSPLYLILSEAGASLQAYLNFRSDLLEPSQAEDFIQEYHGFLRLLAEQPACTSIGAS